MLVTTPGKWKWSSERYGAKMTPPPHPTALSMCAHVRFNVTFHLEGAVSKSIKEKMSPFVAVLFGFSNQM